jgi:hydrogenase expression/formation protein HypC
MCLAIPGQVLDLVDAERRLMRVSVAGVRRVVNVALLDDAPTPLAIGDWVLIHVGFAISRIDEAEAMMTLRLLEEMGAEFQQELHELRAGAVD